MPTSRRRPKQNEQDCEVRRSPSDLEAAVLTEEFWSKAAKGPRAAHYTATKSRAFDNSFFTEGSDEVEQFIQLFSLPHGPEMDMLEIGCGPGRMTSRLARGWRAVHAIDVSQEMINLAAVAIQNADNVTFTKVIGDGSLPIPDEQFDCVFPYLVLQHIPSVTVQARYLAESIRVLRPGGVVAIQLRSPGVFVRIHEFGSALIRMTSGIATFRSAWSGARFTSRELQIIARSLNLAEIQYVRPRLRHTWFVAEKRRCAEGP